ncbi:MAG: hypothetical protein AAGH60_03530 [Pseudomonadota bacterium]
MSSKKTETPQVEELSGEDLDQASGGYIHITMENVQDGLKEPSTDTLHRRTTTTQGKGGGSGKPTFVDLLIVKH